MTPSPIDVFYFLRDQLGTPSGFERRGRLLDRCRGDILAALRDGVAPEVKSLWGEDLAALIRFGPLDPAGGLARDAAMLPDASTDDATLARLVRAVDVLRRLSVVLTARRHQDLATRVDVKVPRRIWEGKTTDVGDLLPRIWELHPGGVTDAKVEEMIRVGPLGQLPAFLVLRARRLWLAARRNTEEA